MPKNVRTSLAHFFYAKKWVEIFWYSSHLFARGHSKLWTNFHENQQLCHRLWCCCDVLLFIHIASLQLQTLSLRQQFNIMLFTMGEAKHVPIPQLPQWSHCKQQTVAYPNLWYGSKLETVIGCNTYVYQSINIHQCIWCMNALYDQQRKLCTR